MRSIALHRLGRVPYACAQALQRELVQLRRRGERCVTRAELLVEHPPVFTYAGSAAVLRGKRAGVTREEIERPLARASCNQRELVQLRRRGERCVTRAELLVEHPPVFTYAGSAAVLRGKRAGVTREEIERPLARASCNQSGAATSRSKFHGPGQLVADPLPYGLSLKLLNYIKALYFESMALYYI